jgi:hypothetical protein
VEPGKTLARKTLLTVGDFSPRTKLQGNEFTELIF